MRMVILLSALGSLPATETPAAEPRPVTADLARRWALHVAPLPQEMEIAAELRLERNRIGISAPPADHPVIRQAVEDLRACVGNGSAADVAFRITLHLGGAEASALESVPNRDQAYSISPESQNAGLRIVAREPAGLFYGAKTLTQLISARSTEAELCIPLLRVTDWPDISERGFWGSDSFQHLLWLGSMKMNLVEQIAAVWVDAAGKGHARLKAGREPMIEEGPRYGVRPLPAVVHLEQLSGKGLFEAYPELKARGGQEGAICYSQAPFAGVLADWIAALGSLPNVSDVDVWMTENLHGKGGCRCEDCRQQDRGVLEVRAILAAWRKAKERLPDVGLRVLLSEETYHSNHLILAELPGEVKLIYYHSLLTYTARRCEIVHPLMEKFAAEGRWLGICPQLTGTVGPASPFSGARFVRNRMKEFVDKRVSGFSAYVTPTLNHARFNVEAAAEWSWNVKGRTTREFALSYAVRHGIEPPELFAQWSEAIGPVAWDLYGSEWPAGERRRSDTPVVEALRAGKLPELGTVRGGLFPHPWGQFRSEQEIHDGLAGATRALQLAERIGRPEIIEESRVIAGYIRSLAAAYDLGKLVGPEGTAGENRPRAAEAIQEFIDACLQAESSLRAWSKLIAPETGAAPGSRYWQIAEVLQRTIRQMRALAADLGAGDFQTRFLTFCDLAAMELNKEITRFADRENADPATHHMPFFEDAHAVRALAVAYDMTGEKRYLDACRRWSDRIIEYQKRMIPAGAYYMNHSRAPGEDRGQWNVADSGSIAMGVLATAIRCDDPAEKAKYLESVKAFAKLVMENYVGPEGGISNGHWPAYDGQWWCSTATFGTMAYILYEETGEKKYLEVAEGALDWLSRQHFREVKPITFEQRPSGIIFYCFELYATGLRYLEPGSRRYERVMRQIDQALVWMAENQKTRGADVPDYLVRNVDMAGLPYLMYAFARQLPRHRGLVGPADGELRYIGDLLLRDGRPNVSHLLVWEVMTWGMMSYAERLNPGAMHRNSKQLRGGPAPEPPSATAGETNVIAFEETLAALRARHYSQRTVDIIETGFRPVGGKVADFAVAHREGRFHFFYIERRLQEGTLFYPGHEIFFGHASTADFIQWQVHDPVMLVRPGTWEEAHVWAPCILSRGSEYVMAYTGVNRQISQNIGLATSTDLFQWKRWDTNPISPCKDRPWAHWREDAISSCRDPTLLEHGGRYWMIYTANTREGASCIAMASSRDLRQWEDCGPICVGPSTGYEARLEGGHPQGSLESANLLYKRGKWHLLVKAKVRDIQPRMWVISSDRMDAFEFGDRREFWPGGTGVEVVRDRDDQSLLATFSNGHIRLGIADWADPNPTARFLSSLEELASWLGRP